MPPAGLEPATVGLKDRCSKPAELRGRAGRNVAVMLSLACSPPSMAIDAADLTAGNLVADRFEAGFGPRERHNGGLLGATVVELEHLRVRQPAISTVRIGKEPEDECAIAFTNRTAW